MGTKSALDRLLTRAKVLELSTGLTETFYDIDVANDLILLAREIAARSREGPKDCRLVQRMAASSRATWPLNGRPVKLTPSHRLYGLGAILLVAMTICSRNFSRFGEPSFFIPLAVAGVAYLLAIRELFSTPEFPKRVIVFVSPCPLCGIFNSCECRRV